MGEPRSLIDFHPNTTENEEKAEGVEGCKRCGYKVFDAEKLMAAGRNWHRRCFKCFNCSKHLDSFLVNDGVDGEIYCKLSQWKVWYDWVWIWPWCWNSPL